MAERPLNKMGRMAIVICLMRAERKVFMKHIKKVVTLFLTFAMVLAMSATAFAAPTQTTLSVKNPAEGHEYAYYQLFVGDLSEGSLSNVKWGADVAAGPLTYKVDGVDKTVTPVAGEAVPTEVLTYLEGLTSNTKATADILGSWVTGDGHPVSSTAVNVLTGYYVIKDKITDPDKLETDTLSTFICKVVGPTEASPKSGTTESDKTIESDTLGADDPATAVNGDVDNVSIGDTVNFKIDAKVPENAGSYNYFYFVINDTLDPGLTLIPTSIKVFDGTTELAATAYSVKTGTAASPKTFQVGLTDAKSLAGKTITVKYSATLNENAEIGEVPNKNTSTVTFSNNPNHDYDGQNNPGFPAGEDVNATGETPQSVTETYTTGIEIQKVDQDGNVLTGAEFTITGNSTEIVLVSSEEFTADESGKYYKLKNGTYTTQEPVTADYMKPAGAGATEGYVVDAAYEGADKVVIDGTTYRPYAPATDGDANVFILVKANADQYDSTTTKYKKTISYTQKNTTTGTEAKAEVGADGVVRFVGLGAGEYTISETKTPTGYNTLPDMKINISFTANPTGEGAVHWSKTSGDATYNAETGVFEVTIENQKGSELPETGGIGTVIFYVLGSLLIVGCGIVLISRRRTLDK